MSSSIQLASTNFSRSLTSLTLPDRRDVVGEYILGTSQAASVVNLANPSLPLSVAGTGSVTYNSHGAVIANANNSGLNGAGFTTGITPYYDHTLIMIRKQASATDLMFMAAGVATDGSGTLFGLSQVLTNTYTYSGSTQANYAQGATRASGTGTFFEAAVFQQGAKSTLYGYSAGIIASSLSPAVRSQVSAPYQIGNVNWSAPQTCEVAYVAIINRVLTSAEVDAAGQSLKAYFLRLGVTVN